jgi:hypothetical protein
LKYIKTLSLLLLAHSLIGPLNAFKQGSHQALSREAWHAVQGLEQFLDIGELTDEIAKIDEHATNDDPNQFRHSMRSKNVSLGDSMKATGEYVEKEMEAAVDAAKKAMKGLASRHIARILHAVQDQKHEWTSCNEKSNVPESDNACSYSAEGCPDGKGNHGLDINCGPGPLGAIAAANYVMGNHQLRTDMWPPESMKDVARRRSIVQLNEFVRRMKQP